MTSVTIGEGIELNPDVDPEASRVDVSDEGLNNPSESNVIREIVREEMAAAVADVERRLGQARELENSAIFGTSRNVHAEDLNITRHLIDGYVLTANSPGAGSIAWSSLHIVYLGVDYTITDGNTALKYTWFIKPGSGTSATLTSSNTLPVLGTNDCLVFVNNGGTPVSILESSITYAIAADAVDTLQIKDGAVTGAKTSFYTTLAAAVVTAQAAADAAQATANGSISTFFQSSAPWPNGVARPNNNEVGDVWFNSTTGQASRWSGTGGSPVNTWIMIDDSDMAAALAAANAAQATADTKNSVFNASNATPPTAIKTNDLWIVNDVDNLIRRWSGSAWVNVQFGDTALAAISGTKIGAGISGTNVTVGTIAAARIGAGVAAADLSSGTGTIGTSQIASAAVTPPKINAGLHLLY